MNVVTKSGTNVLHGTGYTYVRDDSLNAPNPLSGTTLQMDQWQYGGSIGGPIAVNRTFYFANIEQRRLDQTGLTTISTPSVELINTRLAATGYVERRRTPRPPVPRDHQCRRRQYLSASRSRVVAVRRSEDDRS